MDAAEAGRRIKAARALADMSDVSDLAAKINERGMGTTNMRAYERGEKRAGARVLRAVSDATDVPYGFFTVPDLAVLEEPPGEVAVRRLDDLEAEVQDLGADRLARIEGNQRAVMAILRQAVVPLLGEEESPRLLELLDELDRAHERGTTRPRNPRPPGA